MKKQISSHVAEIATYSRGKWTPGPWTNRGNHLIIANRIDSDSPEVVTLIPQQNSPWQMAESWEERAANARLIASAPMLLAACKAMITRFYTLTTEEFSNGGEKIERDLMIAAIKTAEGGTT